MATTDPERQPLLERLPAVVAIPPMLYQPGVEKLEDPAAMPPDADFPLPTWTRARLDSQKRRRPQCIAHRGYKSKFPENTMAAFRGAIKAGAHAVETDVHLTRDHVVVLSHDATLRRCFGRTERLINCTWDEIKDLKTTAKPHVPMPRLEDLLEYLAEPGMEETWLLLDIKLDNDADAIMRLIGDTIKRVGPAKKKCWEERIVLGVWAAKYLPLAVKYLPGFPVTHIAFPVPYARHFLKVPNVSFNMVLPALVAPGGRRFLRDAQAHDRQVYTWTVNDTQKMEWCIRRQLDGVCTDDVDLFLKTCDAFDEYEPERILPFTMRQYWDMCRIWIWISIAIIFFRRRFAPVVSQKLIQQKVDS